MTKSTMPESMLNDPERVGKGLTGIVDPTTRYDNTIWALARQYRINQLFEEGQTTLDAEIDSAVLNTLDKIEQHFKKLKNTRVSSKSTQTSFTLQGGDKLMEEHDSLDLEVGDIPTNDTLTGEVTGIKTGERQDFYDPNDDGEYQYGEADDSMLQIVIECDYKGDTVEHTSTFAYYDNPDPRSNLGAFVRRYGKPEKGLNVNVDFDGEGNSTLVLPN